ncbi:hypothetical protein L226DRAFT_610953 [Lentinus tigrinus ALCF2SS1-7]|uniref:F-box domain-containing protein n=1 Tax=Lentinus tigrinus ALCF2SS1-6 TaxID=1328759 RepID=A0A5C2SFJ5_9APHY|nr:hypothetical protein L227DRAFT_652000 [Lentinus tigrinus ALCF2SS1-6]RPD77724.1 hypothetical protein L226DRAFT_610953 [Lentinus tigrinus ALCF2SS1-7]
MDNASGLLSLPAEVLRRICSDLMNLIDGDDDLFTRRSYAGLNTVLALARTAKGLHECAIDAIWHTLPGYGFLLFTVPRDAWVETKVQTRWEERIEVKLIRPLAECDFLRLKHYAPRVRRVLLDSQCDKFPSRRIRRYCFAHSTLATFASHFVNTRLLPNLGVLHVVPHQQAKVLYRALPVLFGPKLHNFSSNFYHQELRDGEENENKRLAFDLRQMFVDLHKYSPHLMYLTFFALGDGTPPPGTHTAILESICLFQHLVRISTATPLNLQALAHLARLPSLRVLEVHIDQALVEEDDFAPLFVIPHKQFFPHLRDIQLTHQHHINPITILLRCISSTHIRTISVSVPQFRSPYQQVKECITVIGLCTAPKEITKVVLSICPDSLEPPDVDTFDQDALTPLLMLQNLTYLALHPGCAFLLDNADCHRMADMWRNIEVLKLGPELAQKTSQVTLEALVWFAFLCPRLRELSIFLDADAKRLPRLLFTARPGLGREQTALTSLYVGKSPIDGEVAVAGYLSDLFPNLHDLECDWECEDSYAQEDWEELSEEEQEIVIAESVIHRRWTDAIYTLLPKFVLVRKQEREWARSNGIAMRPAYKLCS